MMVVMIIGMIALKSNRNHHDFKDHFDIHSVMVIISYLVGNKTCKENHPIHIKKQLLKSKIEF